MKANINDRVVGALFFLALLCLVLLLLNSVTWFAVAAFALLVLAAALGFGAHLRRPGLAGGLVLLFCGYLGLWAGMLWYDSPETPLRLFLGFPAATAFLVYGIWPLPLLGGLIYGLVFRSSVLPEEKFQKFLAEHGRREPGP